MTVFGFLCGFAAEAKLLRAFAYVSHGDGGVAGARKAVAALPLARLSALVSFGIAGGLDPELRPGVLLIPDEVLADGAIHPTDPALIRALRATLPGAVGGRLVAGDGLLTSPTEKAALRLASGARAVDLESGVAAQAAQAAGLPLLVLRAIADPADASLPPAAQIPLTAGGAPDLPAILVSLVRSPLQIPRLIGLGLETKRGLATLQRALPALNAAMKEMTRDDRPAP